MHKVLFNVIFQNMERQPKEVPVNLLFGAHNPEDASYVDSLKEKVESYLKTSPSGGVIVLTERSNFIFQESVMIFKWVEEGLSPSEAFAQLNFLLHNERLPSDEELNVWRKKYLDQDDEFNRKELEALDELAANYPGRISVMPEFAFSEELEQTANGKYSHTGEDRQKALKLTLLGRIPEALPLFKKSIKRNVLRSEEREIRLVSLIETLLENSEQDEILAIVGYFGAFHTFINHELKRDGFNATAFYPAKRDGVYQYSPDIALARTIRFLKERKLKQSEWVKALILQTVSAVMEAESTQKILSNPVKKEDILAEIWKFARVLDDQTLKRLRRDISEKGFLEAIDDLFLEKEELNKIKI